MQGQQRTDVRSAKSFSLHGLLLVALVATWLAGILIDSGYRYPHYFYSSGSGVLPSL